MAVSIDPRTRGNSAQASPPASRLERSRWRDPRLAVGLALVALSALLGARVLGSADESVGVWVAKRDLDSGRPLTTEDVMSRQVRFAAQRDADSYLSSDQPPPAGAVLSRAVGAGEIVPRQALGSTSRTAVTEVPLSVNTDAVPSTVGTGSVVDVWVTPEQAATGRPEARRSVLVFDDVSVVSAPRAGSSLGPSATRQVIVGVSDTQASALPTALTALAGGAVTLTVTR
ncbi:MAG TPA: hypothetical protein VM688_05935 [Nocardioidaceae bacterium]|nr:hypothetical protein [Nocardioidaceae bacterium]